MISDRGQAEIISHWYAGAGIRAQEQPQGLWDFRQ
jgi:hypothetical protein